MKSIILSLPDLSDQQRAALVAANLNDVKAWRSVHAYWRGSLFDLGFVVWPEEHDGVPTLTMSGRSLLEAK